MRQVCVLMFPRTDISVTYIKKKKVYIIHQFRKNPISRFTVLQNQLTLNRHEIARLVRSSCADDIN